MQQAWARFDQLGNLQTAVVLMMLLLVLAGASAGLLAGSAALLPAASASESPAAPPRVAPRIVLPSQPEAPPVVHARAVTVASSVFLRSEPTTGSESLGALPRHTEVDLLGDDEVAGASVWRHVRTDDDREGWIIGTALVLEPD